jgi:hypothetical protein
VLVFGRLAGFANQGAETGLAYRKYKVFSEVTIWQPSMHHFDHSHQFSLEKAVLLGVNLIHHGKHHMWFRRGIHIEELSHPPILDAIEVI